jgi:hypothetical protein
MPSSDAYSLFDTCSYAGKITNQSGIQNIETQINPYIYVCRHLRQPWEQFWKNHLGFG